MCAPLPLWCSVAAGITRPFVLALPEQQTTPVPLASAAERRPGEFALCDWVQVDSVSITPAASVV